MCSACKQTMLLKMRSEIVLISLNLMITGNFWGNIAVEKEPHHSSKFFHEVEVQKWIAISIPKFLFYGTFTLKTPCLSSPFYTN